MSGIARTQMTVLTAMQSGKDMSLDELDGMLGIERRYIINACTRLCSSGHIERAEKGVYRITEQGSAQLKSGKPLKSGKLGKRSGVRRVRAGGLRQRLWNAMLQNSAGGLNKSFSLPDLLTVALNTDEETPSTYNNAGQYIRQLQQTGYLKRLTRRQPGTRPGSNGFTLYKLERNTGEKAPVVRARQKQIYDPNTSELHTW